MTFNNCLAFFSAEEKKNIEDNYINYAKAHPRLTGFSDNEVNTYQKLLDKAATEGLKIDEYVEMSNYSSRLLSAMDDNRAKLYAGIAVLVLGVGAFFIGKKVK